jgi:carboxylesterase type B
MKISFSTQVFVLTLGAYASAALTVDLGYVKYIGYNNVTSGINYFRGIPYTQPPLGDLRERKPLPIESKNKITRSTIDTNVSTQACYNDLPIYVNSPVYTAALALLPQSEDCLVMDIYVPKNQTTTSTKKLPVMVTIHGGWYNAGSAGSNPGHAMTHQSNDKSFFNLINH